MPKICQVILISGVDKGKRCGNGCSVGSDLCPAHKAEETKRRNRLTQSAARVVRYNSVSPATTKKLAQIPISKAARAKVRANRKTASRSTISTRPIISGVSSNHRVPTLPELIFLAVGILCRIQVSEGRTYA